MSIENLPGLSQLGLPPEPITRAVTDLLGGAVISPECVRLFAWLFTNVPEVKLQFRNQGQSPADALIRALAASVGEEMKLKAALKEAAK